jgi:hypothetical protein
LPGWIHPAISISENIASISSEKAHPLKINAEISSISQTTAEIAGSVKKFVYQEYKGSLELNLGGTARVKRQERD